MGAEVVRAFVVCDEERCGEAFEMSFADGSVSAGSFKDLARAKAERRGWVVWSDYFHCPKHAASSPRFPAKVRPPALEPVPDNAHTAAAHAAAEERFAAAAEENDRGVDRAAALAASRELAQGARIMAMHPKKCELHEPPVTVWVIRRRPAVGGTDYRVQCLECEAAGEWRPSRDGAIAAWNQTERTVKPPFAPDKIPPEDVEGAVRGDR